jgi:hypothetical protein
MKKNMNLKRKIQRILFKHVRTSWLDLCLIYQPDRGLFLNESVRDLWEKFVFNNRANNAGDVTRFIFLNRNIEYLIERGLRGNFAEVGVWRGNTASILAYYSQKINYKCYLYDTFNGFPESDLVGVDNKQKKRFSNTALESVVELVGCDSVVEIRKGYFPDTVEEVEEKSSFMFVSLDADLYKPIKEGLNFFYPRLVKYGMIVVHDYDSKHWPGCKKAVDEFLIDKDLFCVLMPDKSGSVIIQKK